MSSLSVLPTGKALMIERISMISGLSAFLSIEQRLKIHVG